MIFLFMCLGKLFLFLFAVLLWVELWNENKWGRGDGVACILFHDFYQEIPKLQKWAMFEICLKYLKIVFHLVSDAEFKRWRGCHAAPGPDGGAVLQAAAAAVRHPGRGAAVRGAAADDSAAEFTETNDRWACFTDILWLRYHLELQFHAYAMALDVHVILENEL